MGLRFTNCESEETGSDSKKEKMPENSELLPVTTQPKKFKVGLFEFEETCCEAVFCPSFLVYKTQKHLDEKIALRCGILHCFGCLSVICFPYAIMIATLKTCPNYAFFANISYCFGWITIWCIGCQQRTNINEKFGIEEGCDIPALCCCYSCFLRQNYIQVLPEKDENEQRIVDSQPRSVNTV